MFEIGAVPRDFNGRAMQRRGLIDERESRAGAFQQRLGNEEAEAEAEDRFLIAVGSARQQAAELQAARQAEGVQPVVQRQQAAVAYPA